MSDFYSAVNGSDLAVDDLSYLSKGQSAKQLYNSAVLTDKTITSNGTYPASADDADGYSKVTVNVPSDQPTLVGKIITENGTYNASEDNADGYYQVQVNIQPAVYDVTPIDQGDTGIVLFELNKSGRKCQYITGSFGAITSSDTLVLSYPADVNILTGTKIGFVYESDIIAATTITVDTSAHTITLQLAESFSFDTLCNVWVVIKQ